MQRTYKIVALLLDYPEVEVYKSLPEIEKMIAEDNFLDESQMENLRNFIKACRALSFDEWQIYYVNVFDMSKKINLYIFDHIFGDSKERGQAMVSLKEMYSSWGFDMTSNELPDYIPVFLEYISFMSDPYRTYELLNDIKPVLEKLYQLTSEEDVFYKYLFDILLSLSQRAVPVEAN